MTSSTLLHVVNVPLLNTNEPESRVIEVLIRPGQTVRRDDVVCVLETTKSTFDLTAEMDGFVQELFVSIGTRVLTGDVVCTIGTEPPILKPEGTTVTGMKASEPGLPEGMRITKPAQALAYQLGVLLSDLPRDQLVTEAVVRKLADHQVPVDTPQLNEFRTAFSGMRVVIFGGGGHARTVVDLLRRSHQFKPIGIVDDNLPGEEVLGLQLLGTRQVLKDVYSQGVHLAVNAVAGLTRIQTRIEIFTLLADCGFAFPILIHPNAVIEPSAQLADGVQIFGSAFIGSAVEVGFGAIINTGAILSHDCTVGAHAHIAPGAILAGGVEVGAASLIGMGVSTGIGVQIGEGSQIGNGARIHASVPPGMIVRAGATWPY